VSGLVAWIFVALNYSNKKKNQHLDYVKGIFELRLLRPASAFKTFFFFVSFKSIVQLARATKPRYSQMETELWILLP
jgi:hypothetical protein